MVDTITNSIDIWTTAQTRKSKGRGRSVDNQSMYGVNKLRELILDLAVRGKLVPQDPNDEPARVLLEGIAEEKKQLIKRGKINKQKPLLEVSSDEMLFELPKGWCWIRFGIAFDVTSSKRIHVSDYVAEGIPFFRSKEIGELMKGRTISTNIYISDERYEKLKTLPGFPNANDLMLTSVGSIGNAWICDGRDFYYKDGNITKVGAHKYSDMHYVKHFIASPIFGTQVTNTVSGTAYNALTIVKLNNLIFPIPPLKEQHRIVAKVDELMALCDELEQEQTDNNKAHEILVNALLKILTNAKDQSDFDEAWNRISKNFDVLFTTEQSTDQLKQTILQLAVMGKLIPQNPEDEPASILLEKIAKEKAKLVKEGKTKTQKPLPEINEDDKPYNLPKLWKWARLGLTGLGSTGKTPRTNKLEYFNGQIPFLGPGQITPEGRVLESDKTLTELGCGQSSTAGLGDILMVCIGGSIGKSAILKSKAAFNQQLNCIHPLLIDSKYLHISMNCPYFQSSILVNATGSATPIINRSKWEELLVPLPPFNEQNRIVEKVDKLFAICNALKQQIIVSQGTKVQLANTIVKQAIE